MSVDVKIRRTEEWDVPDLPKRLSGAFEKSSKSVLQLCRESGISSAFWYQMIKGGKASISYSTLQRLCQALDLVIDELNSEGDTK
ncbi:MAG: helix-turn-helix transcriptional regulator [Cyanobacteria bacterium P01_E01_bin.6]